MLSFNVCYRGAAVGKVTLEKQGLYYVVRSQCRKMDGVFRLTDRRETGCVMLGVFVPEGTDMVITKRVPVKQLGDGPHSFELMGNEDNQERFAPLDGELPTECLRLLAQARFAIRNGIAGLLY